MNRKISPYLLAMAFAAITGMFAGCADLSKATGRANPADAAGVKDPNVVGGVDFNGPTANPPLYSDNTNWEVAPPFGTW